MPRVVLFDLDNTLVDRDRAFFRCVKTSFPDVSTQAALLALDDRGRGERAPVLAEWKRSGGGDLTASELGIRIAEQIEPVPGLLAALKQLAEAVVIGLVSNGGGETQRAKLRAAGLDAVFHQNRIWISEEVGLTKPDPRLYGLICQELGVLPEECLFLGDHEIHDVAGPTRAGMRAQLAESVLGPEDVTRILRKEAIG